MERSVIRDRPINIGTAAQLVPPPRISLRSMWGTGPGGVIMQTPAGAIDMRRPCISTLPSPYGAPWPMARHGQADQIADPGGSNVRRD